jgi:hypothetical protein
MSFLDRFKPVPRWKHADPAVRAASVAELPDDEEHRAVLAELAADEDVGVRRAAAQLAPVPVLVQRARTETDDSLRRELIDQLTAIAVEAAPGDGDAALALEGLEDAKALGVVAKTSAHDTVRAAALGRIHDPRTLGDGAASCPCVTTDVPPPSTVGNG